MWLHRIVENRTKAEDEITNREQHEALKQTVCGGGTSPDPICRSLTVAWRAGPTVRIRFPPAQTLQSFGSSTVRVYEHVTRERAKKPYWLGDTGAYGGAFYQFALTVWDCLYARIPEVRACLSASDQALAQELQNHWPEQETDRVKKSCEIVR